MRLHKHQPVVGVEQGEAFIEAVDRVEQAGLGGAGAALGGAQFALGPLRAGLDPAALVDDRDGQQQRDRQGVGQQERHQVLA